MTASAQAQRPESQHLIASWKGMCSVTAVRLDSSSPHDRQRPETAGQPADVDTSIQTHPSTSLAEQGKWIISRYGSQQRLRWSAWVWSPPPESNRRPHPYHGSAAKRRANPRLRRSRDTVHAAVMGSVAVASPASAYQHMSYPVRRLETEDRFHKPRAFLNIGLHDGLPHWMYVLDLQRSRLQELQAEGRNLGELLRSGQLTDWKLIPKWQGQLLADGHFLLIAVRHVLLLARHLRNRSPEDDGRAQALFEGFVRGRHGRTERVRGILEHFDRYWIEGEQEPRKGMAGWPRPAMANIGANDELSLLVGNNEIELLPLADDALELAQGLYEVWSEITPPAIMSENPYDPPDEIDGMEIRFRDGVPEIVFIVGEP